MFPGEVETAIRSGLLPDVGLLPWAFSMNDAIFGLWFSLFKISLIFIYHFLERERHQFVVPLIYAFIG